MVIVTFTWVALGFSLSFGTGNALIGNFDLIGLQHVGFAVNDQLSPHIPFALLFQMMFCTIAVSILSGSIAERMKFFPFIIFIFLWVILIYSQLHIGCGAEVGFNNLVPLIMQVVQLYISHLDSQDLF